MIYKGACNKGFIWNSSNCECECDRSCHVGEYLDYENTNCWYRLVDKLVEKCTEYIDEGKIAGITLTELKSVCKCSCVLYIVLFSIIFTINIGVGTYFIYYKYMESW